MKAKKFYTKVFSFNKIFLPFFITIVVMQVAMAILSMVGEQHYIIFADAVAALGLIIAIFVCHRCNKMKAVRILATFVFFTQAVFLTAYSFQPFPKAPKETAGLITFIIYITYALSFFAMTIAALVLHANLNKVRNNQTMSAMYILYTIQIALSLILIIGTLVNFFMNGYTHIRMVDFINYFAYGFINFYLLTIETTTLPQLNKTK